MACRLNTWADVSHHGIPGEEQVGKEWQNQLSQKQRKLQMAVSRYLKDLYRRIVPSTVIEAQDLQLERQLEVFHNHPSATVGPRDSMPDGLWHDFIFLLTPHVPFRMLHRRNESYSSLVGCQSSKVNFLLVELRIGFRGGLKCRWLLNYLVLSTFSIHMHNISWNFFRIVTSLGAYTDPSHREMSAHCGH